MSANIYWEPAEKNANDLPVGGKEAFMDALENAGFSDIRHGGQVFTEEDLPTLRGMQAVFGEVNVNNPYWHLINAIEKHGSVRVWAQY